MGINLTNLDALEEKTLQLSESALEQFGSEEAVIEELRERLWEFGKSKKSLANEEDRVRRLAGRATVLKCGGENQEECGNKHANLVKMGRVVNAARLADFEIPMPESISTDEIKKFWEKRKPVILTHWNTLKKQVAENRGDPNFLETDGPKKLLEEIREAIKDSFEQTDEAPLHKDWLSQKRGKFLMVRSSGAEDSEKTANAGGNVSVAYVPASNIKAVCSAVGEVVQSYFGKSSLQNRINAGLNPFEEDLCLGVVLQELIGEKVGGAERASDIPVSFVLFTNEPLFVGDEPFRIMQLSATFGHGEAVVGDAGIATDTAYLLHSIAHPETLFVLYTNQKKLERLAPTSTNPVVLSPIPNPQEIVNVPALNHEMLLQIYRDAICVEGIFNDKPTDIEGVVKNGVVHFVQARPVNRKPMFPTYLKSMDGAVETVNAEMIVPASASVIVIEDRNEILCAPNLQLAEDAYQSKRPPKLIIVTELPSATSHPVVNFRGLNVPCLCIEDEKVREKILHSISKDRILAVCMQTGSLHLWDNQIAPIGEQIAEGFAVHPATLSISLPTAPLDIPPPSAQEISRIKKQLFSSDYIAISQEIEHLDKEIQTLKSAAKLPMQEPIVLRFEALSQLHSYLSRALEEVQTGEKLNVSRLRLLFYRKTLENLLIGSSSRMRATCQYCLADAANILQQTKQMIDYEKNFSHSPLLLELIPYGSFDPEGWQALLKRHDSFQIKNFVGSFLNYFRSGSISKFKMLVEGLHQTGALPFWYTFFSSDDLFALEPPIDSTMFSSLRKLHENILKIDQKINAFGNLKTFDPEWENLQTLLKTVSDPSWIDSIHSSSSKIIQTIAYQTMGNAVDLLDRSVKEFKASQDVDPMEKVATFKKMLFPYYELMKTWIKSLPSQIRNTLNFTDMNVNDYLQQVKSLLDQKPHHQIEMLNPGKSFSVSAAILGAQTAFNRHLPETLEDMLTLLHQNAMVALNLFHLSLLTPQELENSSLPTPLKTAMKEIEESKWGRTVQRNGLEIEKDQIRVIYNIPLRNHSGKLELIYKPSTSQMFVKAQFLGQARSRWGDISIWVEALNFAGLISLSAPVRKTDLELAFTWEVMPDNLGAILMEYNGMSEWTLGESIREMRELLQRWSTHPNAEKLRDYLSNAPGYQYGNICSYFRTALSQPLNTQAQPTPYLQPQPLTANNLSQRRNNVAAATAALSVALLAIYTYAYRNALSSQLGAWKGKLSAMSAEDLKNALSPYIGGKIPGQLKKLVAGASKAGREAFARYLGGLSISNLASQFVNPPSVSSS